jgi:ribosomal protein S8E
MCSATRKAQQLHKHNVAHQKKQCSVSVRWCTVSNQKHQPDLVQHNKDFLLTALAKTTDSFK